MTIEHQLSYCANDSRKVPKVSRHLYVAINNISMEIWIHRNSTWYVELANHTLTCHHQVRHCVNFLIYLLPWYTTELMVFATSSFQRSFISRNSINRKDNSLFTIPFKYLYIYNMYTLFVNGALVWHFIVTTCTCMYRAVNPLYSICKNKYNTYWWLICYINVAGM